MTSSTSAWRGWGRTLKRCEAILASYQDMHPGHVLRAVILFHSSEQKPICAHAQQVIGCT